MKKMIKIGAALFMLTFFTHGKAQTVSKCDRKFAEKMVCMGLLEVKESELAQSKAVTPSVKTLATQLVESHTKANNELKSLAAKKNISVQTDLTSKQQKKLDKLAKCEGKKFDKKYAHCMKSLHKKSKCKLKKEAKHGKDAELTAWANSQVPIIENHITMLKDACKDIK
jgi:putative membrane protein